jgi:sRNA-binding protein
MSAIQELQDKLKNTNALIARYQEELDRPSTKPSEAKVLKVNVRSLQNLAKQLESELSEHAAVERP